MIDYLEALKDFSPNTTGANRHAAVIIPIVSVENEPHLLFEKRALTLKSQPGEICFPGGNLNSSESPIDAATRETVEELNVPRDCIRIVGQIDSILTSFDMLIHCFVAHLDVSPNTINFSRTEVDHIFTVPISHFLSADARSYSIRTHYTMDESFPFESIPDGKDYNFKQSSNTVLFYHYKEHTIWGLTARMIQNLVSVINIKMDSHLKK